LTCIEQADKYLNVELFGGEKKSMLQEVYGWLSEFGHPNFCSNKSAFNLDKEAGRMVFRHDADLQDSDFSTGWLPLPQRGGLSIPVRPLRESLRHGLGGGLKYRLSKSRLMRAL